MKCIINETEITIYIQDSNIKKDKFNDIYFIEDYFKNLFLKLNEIYHIHLNGFYVIDIYIDDTYGIILEINEEKIDYIEYYDDTIDMKTSVYNTCFLYQAKDILNLYNYDNLDFYLYENKYYIKIKDKISNIKLAEILEYVELITYKDTDKIIKKAKKL